MELLSKICSPALIYLVFALSQVIIDTYKRAYNIAFVKFIQMVVFTLMLNLLCTRNLTWISWIIVAVPFIFMGFMTLMLMYVLKLDGRDNVIVDDDEDDGNTEEDDKETDENDNLSDDNPNNDNDNVVYVRSNQKVVVDDVYFMNAPREYSSSSSEYVS
jgi:predicted neutral ceramidase superfamily lipid hydrolase